MNKIKSLDDFAKELAGNWRKFDSFSWDRLSEIPDPENWAIVYTHNRDSGLIEQSNAKAITNIMALYTEDANPDIVFETHNHWACGWVEGFSIRVYKNGEITSAIKQYYEICQRLDDYPILDETDHSKMVYEATIENIKYAIHPHLDIHKLPDDWAEDIYDWLSIHAEMEIEDVDDMGGYPSEESLLNVCEALNYVK